MALIRWKNDVFNPFTEFDQLQDEINRVFNYNRAPVNQGLFDRTISPAIDVVEDKDGFTVLCDLPGVKMEDLDISVAQDVLTIKGEKSDETAQTEKDGKKVYKKETWAGSFQRTLALPSSVDGSKVEASFKNGVLTVTLPKREEVKPKQISIKAK